MGSSKLPSLDPFDEFDPRGKDQDEYDLMAALLINEDRDEETKVNGMIQITIEMFLNCLKTVMIRKYSIIYV